MLTGDVEFRSQKFKVTIDGIDSMPMSRRWCLKRIENILSSHLCASEKFERKKRRGRERESRKVNAT